MTTVIVQTQVSLPVIKQSNVSPTVVTLQGQSEPKIVR